MSLCLVTGAAGFIGSTLSEALLAEGHQVRGIDCFRDYYPRPYKEANLSALRAQSAFTFIEANLLDAPLDSLLEGVTYVFHLAAQAGVRASWGKSFENYTSDNVLATQRLLEACKGVPIAKFVYSSSSSIYGDAECFPTPETATPAPLSPYGVTKLAGEHLARLYFRNWNVPTVSLRYFTVYGPRQRPDMAFHKFSKAVLAGQQLEVYGDGEQTRDFTFVADAVRANILAATSDVAGETFNVGGGSQVSVNQVLELIGRLCQRPVKAVHKAVEKGDVRHTRADGSKARELLGYSAAVSLEEGLAREVEWLRQLGL